MVTRQRLIVFSVRDDGRVGLAFIGQTTLTTPPTYENDGDVFYAYSDDGGKTWSVPEEIFTRDHSTDTTWGAMRGITINYNGDDPCISFETAWQDFAAGSYRQGDANSLYFWSPAVNGGQAKVLLDTSWANWNPGGGANDVMMGVGRPVLSRSESEGFLLLAFNAATDMLMLLKVLHTLPVILCIQLMAAIPGLILKSSRRILHYWISEIQVFQKFLRLV